MPNDTSVTEKQSAGHTFGACPLCHGQLPEPGENLTANDCPNCALVSMRPATESIAHRPKIFLTAFPLHRGFGAVHGSTRGGDVLGSALAEDGAGIAQHLSSSVDFAKHDMGLTSAWKHDTYRAHYPNGYELVWVDDPATHDGYRAALARNRRQHEQAELAAIASAEHGNG